jgi:NADH-quinone oxidoreductase subunit C
MANPMIEHERLEVVRLREKFGDAVLKVKEWRGETYVCVRKDALVEIATYLRDDPELEYRYFSECLGVDYSTWPHERDLTERFEVVYNLMSLKYSSRLFLKVGANDGETVPTLQHVWAGAEYPEREVQDLFGIVFQGNEPTPGMRFLLPDDWIGYPLRKEYPLGGEDVLFDKGFRGPAVEDVSMPHAGESFEGKTGSGDVSGR